MKAVQFAHFGERDVLEYIDVATPKPKNDDLLIEVTAAGVNFVDIRERMGVYGRPETHVGHIDLPHISGLQAVGTVMEVGPSGDRSRIGAKVMSYLPAGGGYAQFAVAPAKLSVQLPTSIDETAMAALPTQGLTAYLMLTACTQLRPGESVLVQGASGGVGSIAVQIARILGAGLVLGTAGSEKKRQFVRSIGADFAVDYNRDGSTATLDGHGEKDHDHFFGQSSFATYALANERNVVKVSRDVPLERLGPLGCGIQTGAGAVMNALNVRPGTSFASFGAGAVGCSAIMAARAVGATTIVAIDIVPSRLEMAKELGATHAINSKQTNPVEAIRDITGGGVDYSLEASGDPRALHQAIEALGSLGTCGVVGAEPLGTEVSFDVNNLMIPGKGIRGILEGESVPDIFIPQLIELNAQGRFPFEKLVKFYSLDQINQAAQDSEKGDTIKPIIRLM
jgi:Zn-dependent alcohol dehydrogenase